MTRTKRLLTLLLIGLALLPQAAWAENISYNTGNDTLTVSYTGCQASGEYSLFLLKQGANLNSFSVSDILFVDQLTADAGGRIEALFVFPSFPAFMAALGGAFADGGASPRSIGSWTGAAPQKALNLPEQLTEIRDSAFEGGAFTHVYLAENVTKIGNRAFANCGELVYIYIPNATTTISDSAFTGSDHVVIGCHAGSAAAQYAQGHHIDTVIID